MALPNLQPRWYFWATHSRLAPMIEVAKLIARHLANVLTYFKHRITNVVAEGLNSKIALYYHCEGLNLHSAIVTHTKVG